MICLLPNLSLLAKIIEGEEYASAATHVQWNMYVTKMKNNIATKIPTISIPYLYTFLIDKEM